MWVATYTMMGHHPVYRTTAACVRSSPFTVAFHPSLYKAKLYPDKESAVAALRAFLSPHLMAYAGVRRLTDDEAGELTLHALLGGE